MTSTVDNLPHIDGKELIRRVRQKYLRKNDRKPKFLYEYVNDFLRRITNSDEPYSNLPIVRQLSPTVRRMGNKFLAHQILFARPRAHVRSFSMPSELRKRNLSGRILGILPYPIIHPEQGGQFRAHDIYTNISRNFEIIALSFGAPGTDAQITSNLRNVCVPFPEESEIFRRSLEKHIGLIAHRIVLVTELQRSQDLLRKFDEFARDADIIIFSHPYLFELAERLDEDKIVVYDCVDVEHDLFKSLVRDQHSEHRTEIMKIANTVERKACEKSDAIFVTCSDQAARLTKIYGVARDKMYVVPNPISEVHTRIVSGCSREKMKVELGLGSKPLILYLASNHPPHLESLAFVVNRLAPRHPDWNFLILGTVADELPRLQSREPIASNIISCSRPSPYEKNVLYKAVDVAIDPSSYGSGTELKILVYMRAGLPVVSTRVGVRGFEVRDQEHVIIASRAKFDLAISKLLREQTLRNQIRMNAYEFVTKYEAHEIARTVTHVLISTLKDTRKGKPIRQER